MQKMRYHANPEAAGLLLRTGWSLFSASGDADAHRRTGGRDSV